MSQAECWDPRRDALGQAAVQAGRVVTLSLSRCSGLWSSPPGPPQDTPSRLRFPSRCLVRSGLAPGPLPPPRAAPPSVCSEERDRDSLLCLPNGGKTEVTSVDVGGKEMMDGVCKVTAQVAPNPWVLSPRKMTHSALHQPGVASLKGET